MISSSSLSNKEEAHETSTHSSQCSFRLYQTGDLVKFNALVMTGEIDLFNRDGSGSAKSSTSSGVELGIPFADGPLKVQKRVSPLMVQMGIIFLPMESYR
jgi:hypothetical protein